MSRNEWNFRNRRGAVKGQPRPKYIKKGPKKRSGPRFKFNGYTLHTLDDLPKEHRDRAALLNIGEGFEVSINKTNHKKPLLKRIERTF